MSTPIQISYAITNITPTAPLSGTYTVTLSYTLTCSDAPGFTSTVVTTLDSAALYQGVTTDMNQNQITAQVKQSFELLERPAFEAYAQNAKSVRDEIALATDLTNVTGGTVTMSSVTMSSDSLSDSLGPIMRGTVRLF